MSELPGILTFVTALGCGLMAGVFFAFSAFVMKGLGKLPPAQGIAAMQSINITAVTPAFLTALLGTAVLSVAAVVLALFRLAEPGGVAMLVGGLLYLVCGMIVTIAVNMPRNDALAAVDPGDANSADLWTRYLAEWTGWNHVRAVGSLAATASFMLA
jgi:uncharacterized membrane protein